MIEHRLSAVREPTGDDDGHAFDLDVDTGWDPDLIQGDSETEEHPGVDYTLSPPESLFAEDFDAINLLSGLDDDDIIWRDPYDEEDARDYERAFIAKLNTVGTVSYAQARIIEGYIIISIIDELLQRANITNYELRIISLTHFPDWLQDIVEHMDAMWEGEHGLSNEHWWALEVITEAFVDGEQGDFMWMLIGVLNHDSRDRRAVRQ